MKNILIALAALAVSGCQSGSPIEGQQSAQNETPEPGTSNADLRDCAWVVTNDDVAVNILYPDIYAKYWVAFLPIPPTGELTIEGQYPKARYMSYNLYNPRLEPIDALADEEILALDGSVNPSIVGGDRTADNRDYSIRIVPETRPDDASRDDNTLYAFVQVGSGEEQPLPVAAIFYRIYVPDAESDRAGDVPLPTIRYTAPDGSVYEGPDICDALEPVFPTEINDEFTQLPVGDPVRSGFSGFADLQWLKFFGLQSSSENRFNSNPLGDPVHATVPNESSNSGGFASNIHNNYIYSVLDREYGPLAVFEAKLPTTPSTVSGDVIMGDGDMRYWSLCTYEIATQRYYDCLYDENVVLDADNRGVFLVGREDERPANATVECGVNWLPWGPIETPLAIFRHMLPDSDFDHSIQNIPGPSGSCEAPVMGEYFPYGHHLEKAAFEALGCPVSPQAVANRANQFDQTDECMQTPTGDVTTHGES